jgi:predicted phage terminase large subunit-like protein
VRAERLKRSLRKFVEAAWPVIEPGSEFVPGFHIDAVCDHLEGITDEKLRNLLIAMPPRHAKSTIVSVMWPAWEWIANPQRKWLFGSYAASLAIRDSVRCRRLIESPWYRQHWGDCYALMDDQNAKMRYDTTAGGLRLSLGVGGAATGEGGDRIVIDDPHNIREAESDAVRVGACDWFDQVMSTRLNNPRKSAKIVIAQRCHETDLIGHLIEQGGYELLELPAEYEGATRVTSIGWKDPRQEFGDLLWPDRFGPQQIADTKRSVGSYAYAAQYQQRPSPAGGGVLQNSWWRYWKPAGVDLPPVTVTLQDGKRMAIDAVTLPAKFDQQLQSWDLAFKDLATSDYVVGQVYGRAGANKFLLDQTRARMDMPRTMTAIRATTAKWPNATLKLVEDKANGPAVIAMLSQEIAGIVAVNPEGGKESRVSAVSPEVEAGNYYLPHPSLFPWVAEFLAEASAFPKGAHDDQVDAWSQAAVRMREPTMPGIAMYLQNPKFYDDQLAAKVAAKKSEEATR